MNRNSNSRNRVPLSMIIAAGLLAIPAGARCIDFDPPPCPCVWTCCGGTFVYDGVQFTTRPFVFPDGSPTGGGQAEPWNACNGVGGHSLNVNNIGIDVGISSLTGKPEARRISFWYMDAGGTVNLAVNGDLAFTFADFHSIPPNRFHAVGVHLNVTATWTGFAWVGVVELTALPGGCISQISFGGQELCVDDLCGDPCGCRADLNNDGVVDFDDFSVLVGCWDAPCGDLNGDGITDFADFSVLVADWGCGT